MVVGFLHPGAMGASIAGACRVDERLWSGEGRSPATRERAEAAGLVDAGTLGELVERCDVVVSVCPPESAMSVAESVAAAGFGGLYVDVNAVSPATSRAIGSRFDRFVDGGIVGFPVDGSGSTRLYLAGPDAALVAQLWAGSDLDVRVLDGPPGAASALKMAYAGWTKGSTALLLAVRALARAEGIEADLLGEWALSQSGLEERSESLCRAMAPKAWRFEGEMREIAATLGAAGLPTGFHEAAAEINARLAGFKDSTDVDPEAVFDALR